ncbi:MAG: thiamine-phosphate kinase [Lysobacteraceae bacterium]
MNAEFDLIERIRQRAAGQRADVVLGIGDDAAILRVPAGQDLVVSTDTLSSGVHFPVDTPASHIGWKSLAVNLSDLAAMGAQPAWCALNLTIPEANSAWLDAFLDGFFALATQYQVALVGGDTTRGPLSITVTVHGFVPHGMALLRSGAQVGDDIWISGTLGDAAAALAKRDAAPGGVSDRQASGCDSTGDVLKSQYNLQTRLNRPTPRVTLGIALRDIATACIDVSDGLLADLGHIVDASNVGAEISVGDMPTSIELSQAYDHAQRVAFQLSGGDDYELCFTALHECASQVDAAGAQAGVAVTRIGHIQAQPGLRVRDCNGVMSNATPSGYRHFASAHAVSDE